MILKSKNGLRVDIDKITAISEGLVILDGFTFQPNEEDLQNIIVMFDWAHDSHAYDEDKLKVKRGKR